MTIATLKPQIQPERDTAERVLQHLREHGPTTSPKMTEPLGLSVVTANKWLDRLKEQDLVKKSGSQWSLTAAGVARTGPTVSPADLAAVLDLLPSEPHRAMLRLARDAVLTRYANAGRGDIGWPSFALWGSPGSFKTALPRVLGRLFGLIDHEHVVLVTDRGRSDLMGRRVSDSKGRFRWEPASRLSLPVLTLDELDKTKSEAGRETPLRLLQGDSVVTWEGERFTMRATPMVTFNAGRDPREVVPTDRLRRMVMVRATGLASDIECRKAARALFDAGSIPVLDLARLVPAAERIDGDLANIFDEEVPRYLSPEAQAIYPGHALSLIVPGRATFDDTDLSTASIEVISDYLITAQTWGGSDLRLIAAFARHYGIGTPTPADEVEAEAIEIDVRREAVELAETKALAREAVNEEIHALGKPRDEEGIRLLAALKEVRRQLVESKSIGDVGRIDAVFCTLQERAERRASLIAGRVAMGAALPRSMPARTRVAKTTPNHLAMLEQLRAAGHKERPGVVLARLGLLEPDPMPAGVPSPRGRRWRGRAVDQLGVVVFEHDGWSHPTVTGLLDATIARG